MFHSFSKIVILVGLSETANRFRTRGKVDLLDDVLSADTGPAAAAQSDELQNPWWDSLKDPAWDLNRELFDVT